MKRANATIEYKKIITTTIILIVLLTNIGCNPTPEDIYVTQNNPKEFNQMLLVRNENLEPYDYIDYYYEEFLSKDCKVTILLDAEVIIPSVSKLPVIKISPTPISDDMVKWVVNEFTDDKLGYYPTVYMNRSDAELLEVYLQGILMDENKLYDEYGSAQKVERVKENLLQAIKSLEEYYNRENPEQIKIPATIDLRTYEFYVHGNPDIIASEMNMTQSQLDERSDSDTNLYLLYDVENENGSYTRIGVYNEHPYDLIANNGEFMFGLEKSEIHVVNSNISLNIFPTYILYSLPFSSYLPYGSLDMFYPDLTRTMEESISIADDKLKELDLDNFYVESVEEEMGIDIMCKYYDYMEDNQIYDLDFIQYCNSIDADAKFHRITYKPYYYDVPLLEANQLFYDDDIYYSQMEYEVISIRIAEDGIAEFKWTNPTDVSCVLNDNVKIVSLETAIENARTFMTLTYNLPTLLSVDKDMAGYDEIIDSINSASINIDTIKLGLAGIPAYNSTNEYLLIPVWNFYGSYSITSDQEAYNSDVTDYRAPIVSVNAIDGSIIHQSAFIIYN